jgi:outer membrane receptor protein involved in Fe transport
MTIHKQPALRRSALCLAVGGILGTLPTTPAALAQEGQADEVVVITGTRLAQPNLQAISPVTSITAEELRGSGETRIEDVLYQLPQVFAAQSSTVSNGADGTASVDLRGLGSQRTLVLINSRRTMPGDPDGGSAADLNLVPMSIVERVEVLTGGASSVYGADAVAGVVNFILDTDFEGIRIDANYSYYEHDNGNASAAAAAVRARNFPLPAGSVDVGDSRDLTVALGIGGPDARGHATLFLGYRDIQPILQRDFEYSACALNSGATFTCGGSGTTSPAHFFEINPATGAVIGNTIVGSNGALRPYTAADAYNFGPLNYYQRPDERYTAGVFAEYDYADSVQLYGEVLFMDDRSVAQIAPSGSFFTQQSISCSNPLLHSSMVADWCTSQGLGPNDSALLLVGRRNTEGGGRQDDIGHEAYRLVGGARGDINDIWSYDAYVQHGTSKRNSTYLNDFSITRIDRALDAVIDPATGQPACRSAVDGSDPACVPWNIFAIGGVNQGALTYLQTPGFQRAEAIQRIVHADLTAQLDAALPSAETGIGLNFGLETRDEQTDFRTDIAFQSGDLAGQGGPTLPRAGGYRVNEAFVETRIPLVEGKRGAELVSLEAGYRNSDYSLGFSTDTYKFGVDWSPVDAIRLRGSVQRAVRAPNIGELFTPQAVLLDGTNDPCDGVPDPGITLAQCQRTGMTAAQFGNVPENPASQYNGLLGGNPQLAPEEADTTSFGVIWQPDFADLALSLDVFDIDIKDRISGVFGGNADVYIDQCIATGSPRFCNLIHRDEFGSLWLSPVNAYVVDTSLNTGFLATKGIDISLNYGLEFGRHGLQFDLLGTKLDKLETELIEGTGSYDCVGLYGVNCAPSPDWRHVLRTTWQAPWQGLNLTLSWRYFGDVALETTSSYPQLAGPIQPTDRQFPSKSWFDLTAALTFAEDYTLRFGIQNISDQNPPVVGQANCAISLGCNGNAFPQYYDALGRQWFVSMTMDF